MKTKLTAQTKIEDFKSSKWRKYELQFFCKQLNLKNTGNKPVLERRILSYLKKKQK